MSDLSAGINTEVGIPTSYVDGRRKRKTANRAIILSTVRACMQGGTFQPSIRMVARRARISVRSVHDHFGTVEKMWTEALTDEATRRAIIGWVIKGPDAMHDRLIRAAVFGRL